MPLDRYQLENKIIQLQEELKASHMAKKHAEKALQHQNHILSLYQDFERYITQRIIATEKASNSPREWNTFKKGLLRWKKIFITENPNEDLSELELSEDKLIIKTNRKKQIINEPYV